MPTSSSAAFCCTLCRTASIASATTVFSPMAPALTASLSVVGCSKPVSRVPSASLPTITPQAIARSPLLTSPSVLIAVAPCGGSQSCHAPATHSHSPVTRHDLWRLKKLHTAVRLPAIPCLCIAETTSSSVKSGCSSISVSSQGACASNGDVLPPRGLAAQLPVS